MKITMIGHAGILVETQDGNFLMDPIIFDPHQGDLFEICPKRTVNLNNLPKPDVIIISHQHLDHFDIKSLAALPKESEVIFPLDPLIDESLAALGFKKRVRLEDWTIIKYGNTELLTTPSLCPVPEFGILFRTPDGSYWNQVDTIVNQDIIDNVRVFEQNPDVIQAPWQPLLETAYLWNQPISFPYKEYEKILLRICHAKPRYVIPGANGFKYAGNSAWQNKVVFPVTRERFVQDLRDMCNEIDDVFCLNPGDILLLQSKEIKYIPQSSNWVEMIEDDRNELDFRPNELDCNFSDKYPKEIKPDEVQSVIKVKAIKILQDFISEKGKDELQPLFDWKIVYQLTVKFPEKDEYWSVSFSETDPIIKEGRNPLANLTTTITASALYNLTTQQESWSTIIPSGSYRSCLTATLISNLQVHYPKLDLIEDPIWKAFPYHPLLKSFINSEIERWKTP